MLEAVYDVTIAYPDTRPDTEADIIRGGLPRQVNIHMVRHPVSRLPSTYVGLEKWLEERWRDKVSHLTINAPLICFLRRLCWTSSTPLPPSSAGQWCHPGTGCPDR